MVEKLEKLRDLSKIDLWKLYDEKAKSTAPSLDYYREEIKRREQSIQTLWLIILTILVLVATIFSAFGAFTK